MEENNTRFSIQTQRNRGAIPGIKAVAVAVVTGGNKGIGFEIVRGLCKNFNGIVYMTAKDFKEGLTALDTLKQAGYSSKFHVLDIDNNWNIQLLHDHLMNKYGGIDILVNNAAISFNINLVESRENQIRQAKATLRTNYFGTLRVCNILFPILRKNAQVINLSSSCGHLSNIQSETIRKRFADPGLTEEKLSDLIKEYKNNVKVGTDVINGWGTSAYVISKIAICALTRIQQNYFNREEESMNISVNCVHPGFVNTDMTNHKGILTPEEGASVPLYLALQPHGLKGEFVWFDKTVVNWLAPSAPARWT